MEQIFDIEKTTKKIYKDKAIWVGTFIGGPLVAGYLIAENFKVFNENDKARKTWIYSIILTILIFNGVFLIPDSIKIPNQIIPLIYSIMAFYAVQHFQGKKMLSHINSGGQLFTWWRTIIIGLIGAIITIIPILGFALLVEPNSSLGTDSKTYGIMKHEIMFDKSNITDREIDTIADGLTKTTFFDEAVTKYIYVKKVNNNFEISISCDKSVINNSDALIPIAQLKNDLQKLFPNNKIVFNLVVDDYNNIVKKLE